MTGPFVLGWVLAGVGAIVANRLRHVLRGDEAGVVGVDEGGVQGRFGRFVHQVFEAVFEAGFFPDAAALLDEPEAGDVF